MSGIKGSRVHRQNMIGEGVPWQREQHVEEVWARSLFGRLEGDQEV